MEGNIGKDNGEFSVSIDSKQQLVEHNNNNDKSRNGYSNHNIEYQRNEFLKPFPRLRIIIPITISLMGIVIAVVTNQSLQENETKIMVFQYAKILREVSGEDGFDFYLRGLEVAIVGGGIIAISIIPAVLGIVTKLRRLYMTFMFLTFLGSVMSIVGPVIALGAIFATGGENGKQWFAWNQDREQSGEDQPIQSAATPNAFQFAMHDFNLAIFRDCCAARGFTDLRPLGETENIGYFWECNSGNKETCHEIQNPTAQNFVGPIIQPLCTCIVDSDRGEQFRDRIAEENFCEALETVKIDIQKLEVPIIERSLASLIRLDSRYGSEPLDNIPMVGFHEGSQVISPSIERGFGCGLGYPKGFFLYLETWYKQNFERIAFLPLGLAVIPLLLLTSIWIMICIQSMDSFTDDDVADMPAGYQTYEVTPSADQPQSINSNVVPQTSIVPETPKSSEDADKRTIIRQKLATYYMRFDPEKDMEDVNDLVDWALTNGLQALSDKLEKKYGKSIDVVYQEEIQKKLTAFYKVNDPSKSASDITQLSAWAVSNGEDMLNSRLREKFGSDLSSIAVHDQSIGVKVLSDDIDF